MKVSILAILLVATFASSDAFFFRGGLGFGFGGFRRFGLFGGFGRFGLGRFGFGRFGFGGFPVPVPVPVPVAHPFVHPFGKRSDEMEVMNRTESTCEIFSSFSRTSKLTCEGPGHTFECELERHFNVEHFEHELENLRLLSNESFNKTMERTLLLSVRPDDFKFNNFTMERENETMLLTLYHNETFADEGFRVTDLGCWEEFDEMMTHDEQVELRMKLEF